MFFTNITDPVLQYFKNIKVRSFSISLTQMLSSDIFVTENVGNNIYRVFPLFYVDEITSTNPNDKILGSKGLIIDSSVQSYYNFINNDSDVIIDYVDLEFCELNTSLSTSELNSIIQVMKHIPFDDKVTIKNGLVDGEYADYDFDLNGTTIVDNGVLITNETLTNLGTVKLVNPVFSSKYVLHLKVYSIDSVSLDVSHPAVTTEIEVELVNDTPVTIPFDTLDLNNVVGFDADVEIRYDKPVIQYIKHINLLTISEDNFAEKQMTVTAEYIESGNPIPNAELSLYDGETSVATATTNADGVATFTFTPTTAKTYNLMVSDDDGIDSSVSDVVVAKTPTNLTLASSKTIAYIPTSFIMTGVLTKNNNPLGSASVKLYNGDTLVDTLTTDNTGKFTKEVSTNSVTTSNFRAVYDGTSDIASATSEYVTVVSKKIDTGLTSSPNKTYLYIDDALSVVGVLTDEFGGKVKNATVKLYDGNTELTSATTNNNGAYTLTHSFTEEKLYNNLKVKFNETNTLNGATSSLTGIYYSKIYTSISVSVDESVVATTEDVVVTASVVGDTNPASVIFTVDGVDHTVSTKNTDGDFEYTLSNFGSVTGQHIVSARYTGTTKYLPSQSDSLTVTYKYATYITASRQSVSPRGCGYGATIHRTIGNVQLGGKMLYLTTTEISGHTESNSTQPVVFIDTENSCQAYMWEFKGDSEYLPSRASDT